MGAPERRCPRCGAELQAEGAGNANHCRACLLELGSTESIPEGNPRAVELPQGSEATGGMIGPYRLRQKLGEGGMGEVWLAEQTSPVRRKVALKVIKRGMDTDRVVARFEAERQALALMDHPCVARVFEAGATPHGRPYFVMEYVCGVPITEHCDRHRLANAERLALFCGVCEGVQHAHQKAIVHRDLKPSNILVTETEGHRSPKIIDFGIAKATAQRLTERTLFTELGLLVGTPEYMSPEQAEMTAEEVDTRTDVYSLGVLLYELLTGVLPFDTTALREAGFEGIRRKIREEEPSRPSTRVSTLGDRANESADRRRTDLASLRRQLRGDLDWIVMKALEKDRARRYGSPAELAADVKRHLEHQPVHAGPPSTVYRAGKFLRRHRVGVAATAVLALGLVAGTVGASVGLVRARRAAETSERVSDSLAKTLTDVNPERLGRLLRQDLEEQVRESATRQGLSENDIQTKLEEFRTLMAGVNTVNTGLRIMDEEVLRRAGERIGEAFDEEPLLAGRLEDTLGRTYATLGLYDVAEEHAGRAVEIRKRELGPDHADTLASIDTLAALYLNHGRFDEAEALYVANLETRKRLLGTDHPSTLATRNDLANVYQRQGRYDEVEPLYLDILASQKGTLGDDHPDTLASMNNLVVLYKNLGRYDEAERLCLGTLEARRRVLGVEHADTLASMNNLAVVYETQGRDDEAEELYLEALETRRRALGDHHPRTADVMNNLAALYDVQGRDDEAEQLYLETLETRRRVLGEEHPSTLVSMENLAGLYSRQGRDDEAEQLYLETVGVRRRLFGDENQRTLASMNNVAWFLLTREPAHSRKPEVALELALAAVKKTQYSDANMLDTLALAQHLTGDTAKAIETQKRAISLLPEGDSPLRAGLERALATYEAAGQSSR